MSPGAEGLLRAVTIVIDDFGSVVALRDDGALFALTRTRDTSAEWIELPAVPGTARASGSARDGSARDGQETPLERILMGIDDPGRGES